VAPRGARRDTATSSTARRSAAAIVDRTASTASTLTETDVMPARRRCSANSGRFEGACPHSDDVMPASRHASMIRRMVSSTAGSESSNSSAQVCESRSTPSTSWVRSFEPIDAPSIPSLAYSGILERA